MLICGIDEAGRGPLAGPVFAACVILQPHETELGRDSKSLTAQQREVWKERILRHALAWGISWATVEEIERFNILQATLLAMSRAYADMIRRWGDQPLPDHEAWVDGNHLPPLPVRSRAVVGGDKQVPSIGAASILAKTARDRWMERWSWIEPQYGFERHRGYGTREHREALLRWGPGAQHRRSFLRTFLGGP